MHWFLYATAVLKKLIDCYLKREDTNSSYEGPKPFCHPSLWEMAGNQSCSFGGHHKLCQWSWYPVLNLCTFISFMWWISYPHILTSRSFWPRLSDWVIVSQLPEAACPVHFYYGPARCGQTACSPTHSCKQMSKTVVSFDFWTFFLCTISSIIINNCIVQLLLTWSLTIVNSTMDDPFLHFHSTHHFIFSFFFFFFFFRFDWSFAITNLATISQSFTLAIGILTSMAHSANQYHRNNTILPGNRMGSYSLMSTYYSISSLFPTPPGDCQYKQLQRYATTIAHWRREASSLPILYQTRHEDTIPGWRGCWVSGSGGHHQRCGRGWRGRYYGVHCIGGWRGRRWHCLYRALWIAMAPNGWEITRQIMLILVSDTNINTSNDISQYNSSCYHP